MASFSNAAFAQDTAFASTAWDFGGAPPPPPPAPTSGGTVGFGTHDFATRGRIEDEKARDAERLAADKSLALVQSVAEVAARSNIDETQRLTLLYEEFRRIDAELSARYLAEFAARYAKIMAQREEEEAIAMMLIAIGVA